MMLSPPHEAENCPNPRKNEGCVCDLRKWAKSHSDWPIAKLVGNFTYKQLLDNAPGLFEPFPDFTNDGNCPSSITSLTSVEYTMTEMRRRSKNMANLFAGPQPTPNFVSTLLVDGFNMGDIKRKLIYIATGGKDKFGCSVDTLIGQTRGYSFPELSLGEIVCSFCVYAVIVSVCTALGLHILAPIVYASA